MMEDTAEAQTQERMTALETAYDAAATAIERDPDARRAFKWTNELAALLARLGGQTARLRAATAARVAEDEKLSLTGLADRLSVSKSRAAQFKREAAKASRAQEGDPDE